MLTLRPIAATFLALSAVVVVGSLFLPAVNAHYAGSARLVARPWILDAAGLVWMFALWGALVAFMVFLIGWVGEGMAGGEAQELRSPHRTAPDGRASDTAFAPAADATEPEVMLKAS